MEEDAIDGKCNTAGEARNLYKLFVAKPNAENALGRCRCRWENNIKSYLKEMM
jgi:hypothetical protein